MVKTNTAVEMLESPVRVTFTSPPSVGSPVVYIKLHVSLILHAGGGGCMGPDARTSPLPA